MAAAKAPSRSNKEIADDLEQVLGQLNGSYARKAAHLVSELRGEKPVLTVNEQREAERAAAAEAEAEKDGTTT